MEAVVGVGDGALKETEEELKMKRQLIRGASIIVVAAITFSFCLVTWAIQDAPIEIRQQVNASEIGRSVDLVGRLGVPMATVVEIEGRWESGDESKPSGMVLVVTSVNGIVLKTRVEFNEMAVTVVGDESQPLRPKVGDKWHCRSAIEVGQFRNVMEKNWELFYDAPVAPPAWGDGPFVSELILSNRNSRIEVTP